MASVPATYQHPAVSVMPSGSVPAVLDTLETLKAVRTFIKTEFKPNLDFGVIPGTGNKPTLLKAGASKAFMYFNCYPQPVVEKTELGHGHVEYEVTVNLVSRNTGAVVGGGVGLCSSMESKYRFRKGSRKCPSCGSEAIIKGREEFGGGWLCFAKKGGCGEKFRDGDPAIERQSAGNAENENPHDVRNTVLKMAKKRAEVDAALGLGCLSELFTQDLDDVFDLGELVEIDAQARAAEPAARPAGTAPPRALPADVPVLGQPAPGHDPRPYHQVAREAAAEANRLFADAARARGVEAVKDPFTAAQAHGHLLRLAASDGLCEKPASTKAAEVIRVLSEVVYAGHREWSRRVVDAFLRGQLDDAVKALDGDQPAGNPEPEAPPAEEQSQEPKGDAWEPSA